MSRVRHGHIEPGGSARAREATGERRKAKRPNPVGGRPPSGENGITSVCGRTEAQALRSAIRDQLVCSNVTSTNKQDERRDTAQPGEQSRRRGRRGPRATPHPPECECARCTTEKWGEAPPVRNACKEMLPCRVAGAAEQDGKHWCNYCGLRRAPGQTTADELSSSQTVEASSDVNETAST